MVQSGTRLGPYEIAAPLGAGGMGEVYLARDTKLGRDVAVKILPDAFAHDPERLARFEREAHLLASLNHQNIAAIYGLEETAGVHFLVLELVPGKTLAEQLAVGPLALKDTLAICRQMAAALEAAHEKGIVHRDLKPGNVKITPEGMVKVLDFGLAKALAPEGPAIDVTRSPTATFRSLPAGVLLGTAPYMSPEQARGSPLDKRTDIWSFGCVLYEALTGRRAFGGETASDTLASILKGELERSTLPASTPPSIRVLLQRCLEKDPQRRLHDIADARIEIEDALGGAPAAGLASSVAVAAPRIPAWRRAAPWALAAVFAFLALLAIWQLTRGTRSWAQPVRFAVTLPPAEPLAIVLRPAMALSPDGTRLVYAAGREGSEQLYLRAMDRLEVTPIQGTQGASNPFFSPDGQGLGFFAEGKLKRVSLLGGAPTTLCEARDSRGATWGPGDGILFSPNPATGLMRVSAEGGAPQAVTTPDSSKGERTHRWPEILPGGKAVLFTIGNADSIDYYDDALIAVQQLNTGERRILVEGGSNARYSATGHLIYQRAGKLLAVPFDLERLKVTGSPTPVLDGVAREPNTGAAHFALSPSGSLVYAPGSPQPAERSLVWVDRKGTIRPLSAPPRPYREPRLSPDSSRLVVTIAGSAAARNDDVWVYEIARGTLSRLTSPPSGGSAPTWTPDGERVTFVSERQGKTSLFWKPADGSGLEERLTKSDHPTEPTSWSADGKLLAFTQRGTSTQGDIWILPLEGERTPRPFLQTPFDETDAAFSPDGRWVAYASNETGRFEVYVQAFPGPGGKWTISNEGGNDPRWARNGGELFYRNGSKVMSVTVTTRPSFSASAPRLLFDAPFEARISGEWSYDVAPDGQRFIMLKAGERESAPTQLNIVLNWTDELKRQLGTAKK